MVSENLPEFIKEMEDQILQTVNMKAEETMLQNDDGVVPVMFKFVDMAYSSHPEITKESAAFFFNAVALNYLEGEVPQKHYKFLPDIKMDNIHKNEIIYAVSDSTLNSFMALFMAYMPQRYFFDSMNSSLADSTVLNKYFPGFEDIFGENQEVSIGIEVFGEPKIKFRKDRIGLIVGFDLKFGGYKGDKGYEDVLKLRVRKAEVELNLALKNLVYN